MWRHTDKRVETLRVIVTKITHNKLSVGALKGKLEKCRAISKFENHRRNI